MKYIQYISIILIIFFIPLQLTYAENQSDSSLNISEPIVYHIHVDRMVGTVMHDRIVNAIKLAEDKNAELLLITLNTPGGYSSTTRKICTAILNSKVPICTFVYPSGSHAGSAGVYIMYASHIAAMAYTTNIGSAHPVGGEGQDIDSIMNEKVTNDAVAQIKSYAEKHKRNIEWAEKAVRESVNITDKEALEMGVVEYTAESIDNLLDQLDSLKVETVAGKRILHMKKRKVIPIEMTIAEKLLKLITDPNIIIILMTIGVLGITLELYNPGAILPGVVGVIAIIIILYSSQTLPYNVAGVVLILFSFALFIAEIKVVSHGILAVGGLVAFFLGGTMLFDSVDPTLQVSKSLLLVIVGTIGVLLAIVMTLVIRDRTRKPAVGNEGMIGLTAEVRTNGLVYVKGALWKAESDETLVQGDKVTIIQVDNLLLKVKKNLNISR